MLDLDIDPNIYIFSKISINMISYWARCTRQLGCAPLARNGASTAPFCANG